MNATPHIPADGTFPDFERTRISRISRQWEMSQETLAVLVALFFTICSNTAFFRVVHETGALDGGRGALLGLALFAAISALNTLLLLVLMTRHSTKPILTVLLVVTSLAAHFTSNYTVYLDPDMVRSILHTDQKEASELVSWSLLPPLLMFGILPSVLVWRVRLRTHSRGRALSIRAACLIASALIAAIAILGSFQSLAPLMRNHHELRYLITPGNFLVSLGSVLADRGKTAQLPRTPIGLQATVEGRPAGARPRLLVIVVGETVRAQNWGLNGYARQTTPQLARTGGVINFPDMAACGSSTEVSLPCMFSPYGRRNYDARRIKRSESLLHLLAHAGIHTIWRDNQTGCKSVCTGLEFESFEHATFPEVCDADGCLDEVMLRGLEDLVARNPGDMVLVLHQLGNHGPAYSRRYPQRFAKFLPECASAELRDCDTGAIVNAYDNAILYTDAFLAQTIHSLVAIESRDTALIYLSDHGESLGENGLFLHGVPYSIAPQTQLRVPMVMWLSPGMATSRGIDPECLQREAGAPASHDNLFHSVLGLLQVRAPEYVPELDLFRNCTRAQAPT
jgi:lipid A ethanolaminephosphotransferase